MEHTRIDGIQVVHISWKTLAALCTRTWRPAGPGEKHLLKDLKEYLEIVMTSQKRDLIWFMFCLGEYDMRAGGRPGSTLLQIRGSIFTQWAKVVGQKSPQTIWDFDTGDDCGRFTTSIAIQ